MSLARVGQQVTQRVGGTEPKPHVGAMNRHYEGGGVDVLRPRPGRLPTDRIECGVTRPGRVLRSCLAAFLTPPPHTTSPWRSRPSSLAKPACCFCISDEILPKPDARLRPIGRAKTTRNLTKPNCLANRTNSISNFVCMTLDVWFI